VLGPVDGQAFYDEAAVRNRFIDDVEALSIANIPKKASVWRLSLDVQMSSHERRRWNLDLWCCGMKARCLARAIQNSRHARVRLGHWPLSAISRPERSNMRVQTP
jgi:hypothetical protein